MSCILSRVVPDTLFVGTARRDHVARGSTEPCGGNKHETKVAVSSKQDGEPAHMQSYTSPFFVSTALVAMVYYIV